MGCGIACGGTIDTVGGGGGSGGGGRDGADGTGSGTGGGGGGACKTATAAAIQSRSGSVGGASGSATADDELLDPQSRVSRQGPLLPACTLRQRGGEPVPPLDLGAAASSSSSSSSSSLGNMSSSEPTSSSSSGSTLTTSTSASSSESGGGRAAEAECARLAACAAIEAFAAARARLPRRGMGGDDAERVGARSAVAFGGVERVGAQETSVCFHQPMAIADDLPAILNDFPNSSPLLQPIHIRSRIKHSDRLDEICGLMVSFPDSEKVHLGPGGRHPSRGLGGAAPLLFTITAPRPRPPPSPPRGLGPGSAPARSNSNCWQQTRPP